MMSLSCVQMFNIMSGPVEVIFFLQYQIVKTLLWFGAEFQPLKLESIIFCLDWFHFYISKCDHINTANANATKI